MSKHAVKSLRGHSVPCRRYLVSSRCFSSHPIRLNEAPSETAASPQPPSQTLPLNPSGDTIDIQTGQSPTAEQTNRRNPLYRFEQLPLQCFQEARKVLAADREEKLVQIQNMKERIAQYGARCAESQGGEHSKRLRLVRMQEHLQHLKILADSNDPMIKKRFEDGSGDMNRPIYRYMADRKWRSYRRPLLLQRISQFHLVPDIVQYLDPTVAVTLHIARREITPGAFVRSTLTLHPPKLYIQPFTKGEQLVTIAILDPDIPDLESDSFKSRCHFLAVNIPISATNVAVSLADLDKDTQVIQPWLPPYSQKGAPYHRLPIIVLHQSQPISQEAALDTALARASGQSPPSMPLDLAPLREYQAKREDWTVKQLMTHYPCLKPIGANLFRTVWDEGTDSVMEKVGVSQQERETEFVRRGQETNRYKKKDGKRYR